MKLFLAPHNDDETLFGAFTLLRERPLVVIVTDSYVQEKRGDGVTADQRWAETLNAMRVLDCSVMRLGLRDDTLKEAQVEEVLRRFMRFETVYAPAVQGGHKHHDLIARAAERVFPNVLVQYCTYDGSDAGFANTGARAIHPTAEERRLKSLALTQYPSQLPRSRRHFEAVEGQPEWLTP